MNALPLSFQAPVKTPATASEQKTPKTPAAVEAVDFAQLLNAASSVSVETQQEDTSQREELLAQLENQLSSLQELPQENLTPEQQEMMQAIMQMMTQLLQSQEEKLQGTGTTPEDALKRSAGSEEAIKNELVLTPPVLEKLANPSPEQAKLIDVLEDAVELLKKLTTASPVKTGDAPGLSIDAEKLEQVFNQLASAVEQLETEQKKSETKEDAVKTQQLEQVLKQVTGLKQEPINLVQPKEIQQPLAMPVVEASIQPKAEAEEVSAKPQEAPAPALNEHSLPAAGAGTEAAKASQIPQRPEASVPQTTVRMSNLVEELGEVLRGSFRLNSEGDNKQIKISIFPEHLGHMDIRLTSVDGKIVAQIFTSSLAAKEMLDQQASLLRSSMIQQGIAVEKIEISQQSSQQSFGQQSAHLDQRFSQQQKQGSSSHSRNGYQRFEEDAATIVRRQSNDGLTMKVDYTI
ncbi:flagellar hook-length control protein FliK [Planococcus shixiaomingii]|uniref:flagellar hook-length control protein FliK n=1 Tax=Planococcus shixiaomingii TaxID=3058393 RepID=UPI002602CCCE|nr:flagellar hook-length control protein FliK [Planococcus sp. N022]WKA53910.1 flagellar hook-length control protein FliK [Planococcus sp. N022]